MELIEEKSWQPQIIVIIRVPRLYYHVLYFHYLAQHNAHQF